jgi:ABC-type polysaccharide/polyol phosphate export permease
MGIPGTALFNDLAQIQGAYRQTALGMSWLLLRPVISMVVLTAVFGSLLQVPWTTSPSPVLLERAAGLDIF